MRAGSTVEEERRAEAAAKREHDFDSETANDAQSVHERVVDDADRDVEPLFEDLGRLEPSERLIAEIRRGVHRAAIDDAGEAD
jgi:hypothetical protein